MNAREFLERALAPVRALLDNPPRVRGSRRAAVRRKLFAPKYRTVSHQKWVPGKPDKDGEPTRVQVTRQQVVRE